MLYMIYGTWVVVSYHKSRNALLTNIKYRKSVISGKNIGIKYQLHYEINISSLFLNKSISSAVKMSIS